MSLDASQAFRIFDCLDMGQPGGVCSSVGISYGEGLEYMDIHSSEAGTNSDFIVQECIC